MATVGPRLEYMVRSVHKGVKRLDLELEVEGVKYEVSCYRVGDVIRIDLKPLKKEC